MSISTLPTNSNTNDAIIQLQKQLIDMEDNMIVYNGKTPNVKNVDISQNLISKVQLMN